MGAVDHTIIGNNAAEIISLIFNTIDNVDVLQIKRWMLFFLLFFLHFINIFENILKNIFIIFKLF
jgi:hypothetical protein